MAEAATGEVVVDAKMLLVMVGIPEVERTTKKTSKVSLTLSHHELDGRGRGGNAVAYPIILEALEQSISLHLTFARVCNIGPVAKKNLSPQLSSPTYAADGAGLFRLPPWHFAAAF